jgi:hypothetical protein
VRSARGQKERCAVSDFQNAEQRKEAQVKPSTIIKAIRAELGPHLLKQPYKSMRPTDATPSWGCCYVASEALYHLWGKENGYTPMVVPYIIEKHAEGKHWFLEQRASGLQLDITADQFDRIYPGAPRWRKPDYAAAKAKGFMTKKPSKRAQRIIDAVLKNL